MNDKQIIENFNVREVIKRFPKSGQKQVFLVNHKVYGKVILKLVQSGDERVKREIEIVTENNFYNVPKVICVGNYDSSEECGIYILEQYIQGMSLREIIKEKSITLSEELVLAETMLKIIVQMEQQKIVHRDIKPENILRNTEGEWYLIDFGIARALDMSSLTFTKVEIGPHTPGYGAPELFQYNKKDIDSRADIFSLGVVLFEAVTGYHPFIKGDEMNLNEIWYNTVTVMPESVVIEGDYNMQYISLIQNYMQKHVTRRPNTAQKALEWFYNVKDNLLKG
ncbi:TPA: serine/threonine protein kinase [Clostridioides difficile]|uniref:serine/threonine-protein kinase n=1 Tax=Clostridioides difficile TaxID=1496 RepID=UPI000307E858|nr:serine/threonine-protein kinase [Clostridioides difficile]MDL0187105.1 serine/threonine-protein kinase [Clostridioides difficile]MDL0190690.1 serine/threonine-protein kinase [Clostridioides difficile]HBF2208123.1 serine/threonine protein kinase [Clostridioides difficile]HBG3700524.1 serine/threonine protein kinase [Clostridioides difficile]HBH0730616.1 serine/threonine protein kinase [Clostridioides difficile]